MRLVTTASALTSVASVLLSLPAAAAANHCQPSAPGSVAQGFRAEISGEAATFDTRRGEGSYEGVALGVAQRFPWLRLRLAAPFYHLVRVGSSAQGPGDVLAEVSVPVLRAEHDAAAAGLLLAGTAPTGNADRQLGMGHVMLMPGVWGEAEAGRWFFQVQLGYGRALGASDSAAAPAGHEHDHHHAHHSPALGPSPIVNPMNESELTAGASVSYRVGEPLRVRSGAYGAVPIDSEGGASRGVLYLADDLRIGGFDVGLEGHVPFAGDPFIAKVLLTVGRGF